MFLSLLTICMSISRFCGFAQIHLSAQLWLSEPWGADFGAASQTRRESTVPRWFIVQATYTVQCFCPAVEGSWDIQKEKGDLVHESKWNLFLSDVVPRARDTMTNRAWCLSSRTQKLVGKTHTHRDRQRNITSTLMKTSQGPTKPLQGNWRPTEGEWRGARTVLMSQGRWKVCRAHSSLQDWLGAEAGVRTASVGSHQGRRSGLWCGEERRRLSEAGQWVANTRAATLFHGWWEMDLLQVSPVEVALMERVGEGVKDPAKGSHESSWKALRTRQWKWWNICEIFGKWSLQDLIVMTVQEERDGSG